MRDFAPISTGPITRDRVGEYGTAVGDHNPIHFDRAFAAGLPDTVVHGPFTAALIIDALVQEFGRKALLNFDLRLRAPVLPNDVLTIRSTNYGVEVRNQSDAVVATAVVILAE
jgi:acyl dehydratase